MVITRIGGHTGSAQKLVEVVSRRERGPVPIRPRRVEEQTAVSLDLTLLPWNATSRNVQV